MECPLPRELRELLERGEPATYGSVDVDLTGGTMDYEDLDLFPCGHPIATDGAGNFWVVDVTPATSETAPVFFASHDPPVVVFQSDDVAGFLRHPFAPDLALRDGIDHRAAVAAGGALRELAETLDDRFVFVDLRDARPGDGFEWGRHGPRTDVRRHGFERVFALAPPERKPGRLSRLLRGA